MSRYSIALATSVCISTACRSASSPVPEPISPPVISAPTTPADTRTNAQWSIPIPTGTHTYNTINRTVIQKNGDQSGRRDTVEVSIWFTVNSNEQADSIVLRGTIDSTHSRPSLSPTPHPLPFIALIKSGQIRLSIQDPSNSSYSCTNTTMGLLIDLLPVFVSRPSVLSTSSTWKDSSTTTTCSSGVALTSQRIRSYQVLAQQAQNGTQILELHRSETSTLSGSGAQNQHQIEITGENQGIAEISIDTTSGLVMNLIAKETASVSITSSGQKNFFIQQIYQTTRLLH